MNKFARLLLICFLWIPGAAAQWESIDSLHKKLFTQKEDTGKLNTFDLLAYLLIFNKPDSSIFYAEKAEKLAIKLGLVERQAEAVNRKATGYTSRGDLANALIYHKESIELAKKIGSQSLVAKNIGHIGLIYRLIGINELAVNYYHQSLAIFLKEKNYERIGVTYHALGYSFLNLGKYDSAIYYLDKAAPIVRQYAPHFEGYVHVTRAKVAYEQGDYALMDTCLANTWACMNHRHSLQMRADYYQVLTLRYLQKKQVAEAKKSIEVALNTSFEIDSKLFIYMSYQLYSQVAEQEGDLVNALRYQKKYISYKDSLESAHIKTALLLFESEQKKAELALQKQALAQERQRRVMYVSGLAATVVILVLVVYNFMKIRRFGSILLAKNREIIQQKDEILQTLNVVNEQKKIIENQNYTKDKLFSIIGHDLRSPIKSLKMILELASQNQLTAEEFAMLSGNLKKSVENNYLTLDNLLKWANTQLQGIEAKPQLIDLHELVQQNIGFSLQQTKEKNIALQNLLAPGTTAFADYEHTNVVVRNLVNNALKFTESGGQVTVSAVQQADVVEVAVCDSGIGMSADTIAKLFRADAHFTTYGTHNEKGTGLGLLLCKEMLLINHGKIWIESELGKGSTFKFSLPNKQPIRLS
jgi:signal transduction histidine kinase